MKVETKAPITSNLSSNGESPVKQVNKPVERDSRGRLLPGSTANPNGRPPAGKSIVDSFRDNPQCQSIIDKLFTIADTLGDPEPHKDAMTAGRLILERLVPNLKASEIRVDTDNDAGFVFLPTPEEPEKE